MLLALATSIPVSTWLAEDDLILATALDELDGDQDDDDD